MASVQEVLDALATQINTATGLRAYGYVPDDASPPFIFMSLGLIDRGAFRMGQMEFQIDAALFVSKASDRVGQQSAFSFASWGTVPSVWNAIDDTPGLGLSGTNAAVLRYRPLGIEEIAGYGYFGGVFEIQASTTGAI
jgi:hypothetical protein